MTGCTLHKPFNNCKIWRQLARTRHLVDQFVQLSRAESVALNRHDCDLGELVQQSCDSHWPLATQRRIHLQCTIPDSPAFAKVDEDLMRRAVGNLISNAIRYCAPEDTILCRLIQTRERYDIQVQDSGPGIPDDLIPSLFDRYWRAPQSARTTSGSGLGLSFVQIVAQRHGGEIRCESTVGVGTCFTLSVPAEN